MVQMFGWQKKFFDELKLIAQKFAENNKGAIHLDDDEINIRILTNQGYVTVQVGLRSRDKLEVTGIKRSGLETKRTIFKFTETIDSEELEKALHLALTGG